LFFENKTFRRRSEVVITDFAEMENRLSTKERERLGDDGSAGVAVEKTYWLRNERLLF
jgi:hypothetical protein